MSGDVAVGAAAASGSGSAGIARALLRSSSFVLFAVLPALLMVRVLRQPGLGWDFRAFYLAGRHYASGLSPYPGHSLAALASKQVFVYPAPIAALFVPLAVLPYTLALTLWLVGSIAAVVVGLRILGVRDWRCLGAAFLSHPVEQGVHLGTCMPALMLLLALLWRVRDRAVLAALVAALVALSKLFLLPLLLWLAVTRRLKAAALAVVFVVALCALGWLPLPLEAFSGYPVLLHALARFEQTFSYSLTSFALAAGLSTHAAAWLALVVFALLMCAAAGLGRRDEFLAFRLVLAASFLLSPIVWGHYYVLLLVPVAIRWPRLSPVWLAAIWIKNDTLEMWQPAVWIALALLVMFVQLGLTGNALRYLLGTIAMRRVRLIGAATVAALLVASMAAAEPGRTGNATLRSSSARSAASGAAIIRVDQPHRLLCWRIWTQGFPDRRDTLTIAALPADTALVVSRARLGSDAQSRGCTRTPRAAGVARRLIPPGAPRLKIALVGRSAEIVGLVRRQ